MPAIGYVTRSGNGFKGQLRTLTIPGVDIEIVPNGDKTHDRQPDYRVTANGVEVGAAWNRRSETLGQRLCVAVARRPGIRAAPALRQSWPRRWSGRR